LIRFYQLFSKLMTQRKCISMISLTIKYLKQTFKSCTSKCLSKKTSLLKELSKLKLKVSTHLKMQQSPESSKEVYRSQLRLWEEFHKSIQIAKYLASFKLQVGLLLAVSNKVCSVIYLKPKILMLLLLCHQRRHQKLI